MEQTNETTLTNEAALMNEPTLTNETTLKGKIILHGLSALIPIVILGTMFALHGVYPFGDRQILVTDFWHQYYQFISEYWHRIRDGGSLLWSWTSGGGHDYVAHIAYYLASPFNLLAVLFPHAYLREVLTVFLLFKLGFASFFMSLFLRIALKKSDILLPAFSALYALCAFALGYYWNIMWMDTFAIMPLVMLGVYSLVKEGKYKIYTISLALAILFNFYIGIFVCIFVAIMFFAQSFIARLSRRECLKRMVTIGLCTVLALGMSAVLLLPVYSALQNSYRADVVFPAFRFYNTFAEVLGNFIAFTPPTSLEGLPNLYSGMISIMLLPVFLLSDKVSRREKVAYASVLVFLILSVNINVLNFIWHGFTIANMLPFRYSFIASFVVIVMAYRAFTLMDEVTVKDVVAMGVSATFFLWMAATGSQDMNHIINGMRLSIIYIGIFVLAIIIKPIVKMSNVFKYALFVIILIELSFTAYNGVDTVRTTEHTSFTRHQAQTQQLLDARYLSEEPDFFRTELSRWHTHNDPTFYGFDGIAFFSSFVNVSATNFMEDLGLASWDRGNRFNYAETSPLTSSFLNLRYLITRDHTPADDHGLLWEYVASAEGHYLFRNNFYLPFGFTVNEEILDFVADEENPFITQNEWFRLATGLDEDLFTMIELLHVGSEHYFVAFADGGGFTIELNEGATEGMFRFNYEVPTDGLIYAYMSFPDASGERVAFDGERLKSLNLRRPYIFAAGHFEAGQIVSFEADASAANVRGDIFVGLFNQEVFEQGFDILSAETLELTQFSDTRFAGTVTVSEPRLLYTSLPYANNWRVFVNGVEEEIVTIGGAMAGVRVGTGVNTVEFRYRNQSVNLGAIISFISWAVYGLLIWFHRSKGIDVFDNLFDRLFASKESKERTSYLFFGGVTTLINWVVYSIAVEMVGFSISVSNVIAWVFAVAFAFMANKMWVFEDREWQPSVVVGQAGTFVGARLATGLIELIGVPLLVFAGLSYPLFGIEGFAAKLIVSVVIVVLNYLLSKNFVFKSAKAGERSV
ncbi:MAG: YfhO family protein [Turicibacter sp.]|nr:YfhO family protein [Turicibacter sp.]